MGRYPPVVLASNCDLPLAFKTHWDLPMYSERRFVLSKSYGQSSPLRSKKQSQKNKTHTRNKNNVRYSSMSNLTAKFRSRIHIKREGKTGRKKSPNQSQVRRTRPTSASPACRRSRLKFLRPSYQSYLSKSNRRPASAANMRRRDALLKRYIEEKSSKTLQDSSLGTQDNSSESNQTAPLLRLVVPMELRKH